MKAQLFKSGLTVGFIVACVFQAYTQSGYIIKKDSASYNVKIIDQGPALNSLRCISDSVIYEPFQVIEYGFEKGRIYKAFKINLKDEVKSVFLEHVVQGKVSLYAFHQVEGDPRYFLTKGDTVQLTEVKGSGEDYHDMYLDYMKDCASAVDNLHFVKPKRISLTRLVRNYNSCSNEPFPRLRWGVSFGLSGTKLIPIDNTGWARINFKNDWGILVGAFMDQPIGSTRVSFHPEIYFKRNSYSYAFKEGEKDMDLVINCSSVSLPLLARYTLGKRSVKPFVEGGALFSHMLKNSGSLYSYTSTGNNVYTEILDKALLDPNLSGVTLGMGLLKEQGNKRSWWVDLRYSQLFGLSKWDSNFNLNELTLRAGFAF